MAVRVAKMRCRCRGLLRDLLPSGRTSRPIQSFEPTRNHADRPRPGLHQIWPSRYRKRRPQPKGVLALRIQMDLHQELRRSSAQCSTPSELSTLSTSSSARTKNAGGVLRVTRTSAVDEARQLRGNALASKGARPFASSYCVLKRRFPCPYESTCPL